ELVVWSGAWYFFSRVIAKGVDDIAPSDTLFHHPDAGEADTGRAGGGFAKPTFAKPTMDKSL
ncbi:cytochrome ubiquinol oxidase subunit I, partial [Acidithiobacillus caldus]|nr:cytochrome ubiquinol oxidase subunit I [Acidithiobacillus caldus]